MTVSSFCSLLFVLWLTILQRTYPNSRINPSCRCSSLSHLTRSPHALNCPLPTASVTYDTGFPKNFCVLYHLITSNTCCVTRTKAKNVLASLSEV
ncbi:hypothetical protein BJ165DRAFT_578542 [Panaeolus papilionaceus]|nr:hypothetical protein BJ165DRAFT_578542 [Panaeolus papilionaceus]